MTHNNEFQRLRTLVGQAVNDYKTAFEECQIKDQWHSETILRKATPFLNGKFTLAIAGKMSSGKSTFINTLIGKDLLPTGHFQTTSIITYIEHAEQPKMVVTYCDGHEQTFAAEDIKTCLKGLVSIPEKFVDLPVTRINDLIANDETLEDVLLQKEAIEKETRTSASQELWCDYYKTHPKSKIARVVKIYYPLSSDFHGWQIVDTPGVGATGGIQDETHRLFAQKDSDGNKLVDAIIFLQNGADNIVASDQDEFVSKTFAQLADEAKARLFFVLTHATSDKFRNNKEDILKQAKQIYTEQYHIPAERVTYVDSLMAHFCNDLKAANVDVSGVNVDDIPCPDSWDYKQWETMCDLIDRPLKRELKSRNLARNNENMFAVMEDWGNFRTLKERINAFVRSEKEQAAEAVRTLIRKDYESILAMYTQEIDILNGGVNRIKFERGELDNKRISYNNIVKKLAEAIKIEVLLEQFAFVDEELDAMSQKKSILEVRTAYQNIMDRAVSTEKEIFGKLADDFNEYRKYFDTSAIILDQIDFESLVDSAHKESTSTENVFKNERYQTGCFCNRSWHTRRVKVGTKEVTDEDKKLETFKTLVRKEARDRRNMLRDQLKAKSKSLCDAVAMNIDAKLEALNLRFDELENSLSNKDTEINQLLKYQSIIESHLKAV